MIRTSRVARALAAFALLTILLAPGPAWAHQEIDCGSFACTVGWTAEPVIVGQPNGLEFGVRTRGASPQPVTDAASTLQFSVEYGSVVKSYPLVPVEGEDGAYTAAFIPTRIGQYTFRFAGTINGEAVDFTVEPEEVVPAAEAEFPEPGLTTTALAKDLASARTLALAGIALGVVGIALAGFALFRKK